MPHSPSSRVVLITGCSSGIGRALCEEFHARGLRVVATARRVEMLDDLRAKGMAAEALDVTDEGQARELLERIRAREGRLDMLVNNAGYGLFGPLLDLPEAEVRRQFETNVFAPLRLARLAAPAMRGGGVIVNIGSISGVFTTPFSGAYCASKAALHALSDALRLELAPFGIRVVTVQPGGIESGFGAAAQGQAAGWLRPDSWYAGLQESIRRRAGLSQQGATPAGEFARRLAGLLLRGDPPAVIRLGRQSRMLPLLQRLLPRRALEAVLRKKFGLADKIS